MRPLPRLSLLLAVSGSGLLDSLCSSCACTSADLDMPASMGRDLAPDMQAFCLNLGARGIPHDIWRRLEVAIGDSVIMHECAQEKLGTVCTTAAAGFWGLGLDLLGKSRRPQPFEDSSLGTRPLGSSAGKDPGNGLSLSSSFSPPCRHTAIQLSHALYYGAMQSQKSVVSG